MSKSLYLSLGLVENKMYLEWKEEDLDFIKVVFELLTLVFKFPHPRESKEGTKV